METTATLQNEHNAVLIVLDQLERAAKAAERGAAVPADVFEDVKEFIGTFVDRCHHGKEEAELFPRMSKTPDGADLVQRLEADHQVGRTLAAAYGLAVADYAAGRTGAAVQLADAVAAYADALRLHIELETALLLPFVERSFAGEDQTIAEAFERIETERIGVGTHERLHGMIESLGPRIAKWVEQAGVA